MLKFKSSIPKKELIELANGDLLVHHWSVSQPKAVVAFIHGLQSHASWNWELAKDFTSKDVSFICMDRYGSGLSKGEHDEFVDPERLINDYVNFFSLVFDTYPNTPIIAAGHCLGGSILTALLSRRPELCSRLQSITIISAWLGKMNQTLTLQELNDIRSSISDDLWDVGLSSTDFSHNTYYQNFIENDSLAIKMLKSRTRKNILAVEDIYIKNFNIIQSSNVQYITVYDDPIVKRVKAIAQFIKFYGSDTTIHLLSGTEHFIPFSANRNKLVSLMMMPINEEIVWK